MLVKQGFSHGMQLTHSPFLNSLRFGFLEQAEKLPFARTQIKKSLALETCRRLPVPRREA